MSALALQRLEKAAEKARDYAGKAKAPNTLRSYRAAWDDFAAWCAAGGDGNGRGHSSLPGSPGRERCATADHQLLGVGAALLLHRDARPAGPVAAPRPGPSPPQAAA